MQRMMFSISAAPQVGARLSAAPRVGARVRRVALLLPLAWAGSALAQTPAPVAPTASPPAASPGAPNAPGSSGVIVAHSSAPSATAPSVGAQPAPSVGAPPSNSSVMDSGASTAAGPREFSSAFEAGLRLGIGLPVGNAGHSPVDTQRKVSDLATWRVPLWIDVGYHVSPSSTYGVYAQFGVGGSGDSCSGKCDWSDLRFGAQGQWHLQPSGDVDPWLGLGLGIEALSFQQFGSVFDQNTGQAFGIRIKELLWGPELLLQGGLGMRVDDAVELGPYLSASVGNFVGDSYKCEEDAPAVPCPTGSAVNGSAFHAWIGIGLSGRYLP